MPLLGSDQNSVGDRSSGNVAGKDNWVDQRQIVQVFINNSAFTGLSA